MREYKNPFAILAESSDEEVEEEEIEEEEIEEEEIPDDAAPEEAAPGRRIVMRGARQHMVNGRWNGENISGCHNSQNFEQMVQDNNLTIEEVGSTDILTEYEIYGDENKTEYLGTKTVYNSAMRTDEEMFGLAERAMSDPNAFIDRDMIEGTAGGIAFRGYLNEDGHVKVVYPIMPWHVHF